MNTKCNVKIPKTPGDKINHRRSSPEYKALRRRQKDGTALTAGRDLYK